MRLAIGFALLAGMLASVYAGRTIGAAEAAARDRALITSLEVMQCTKGARQ